MTTIELLENAVKQQASDIFVVAGLPISYRVRRMIKRQDEVKLTPADTQKYLEDIYQLASNRDISILHTKGDDDFSFSVKGLCRFRASAYKQRGSLSVVIRVITFDLPKPQDIGIPQEINQNQNKHIITLEDPIEYLHRHNQSIVSQREIHVDAEDYVTALRASLRQSPDVILLGEMRDYETIGSNN